VAAFYNLLKALFWELPPKGSPAPNFTLFQVWQEVRMLVLSRKTGETIVVNNNIRITVVEVRGDKVRLGIAAPEDVIVDRQEIHEKRKNQRDEWAEPDIWSYSLQESP
jgi:carbon storage regulator